jgi:hypothetical protein
MRWTHTEIKKTMGIKAAVTASDTVSGKLSGGNRSHGAGVFLTPSFVSEELVKTAHRQMKRITDAFTCKCVQVYFIVPDKAKLY